MRKHTTPHSTTFTPPKVTVSLVEPGSRLDLAQKTKSLDAATPAEIAELEFHSEKLRPSIAAAVDALSKLDAFEARHKADLQLLRGFNFDGVRGRWPDPSSRFEATRVRAEHAVLALFTALHGAHTSVSSTTGLRDALTAIPRRVDALSAKDMRGPRMSSDAPGIRAYHQLPPASVERIRLDVAAAVRHVDGLPRILETAQQAVAALIAYVEKMKRLHGESSAVLAHVVNPDLLRLQREAGPGSAQTKADASFTGYEAHDKK